MHPKAILLSRPKIERWKHHCGVTPRDKDLGVVKNRNYYVDEERGIMPGEQLKCFVRIYEYGVCGNRGNTTKWTPYIAKFPGKMYPIESITEHLITRIGQALGVRMADSRLGLINGQVRFMSRFFRNESRERLFHGAEIYSAYIGEEKFIDQIGKARMEREMISVEFTHDAIEHSFPEDFIGLIEDFVKMLLFDALVGVNDRHFYNWGVIQDVTGSSRPRFAPLFDSSRGLLWNFYEHKVIAAVEYPRRMKDFVKNYVSKSRPNISLRSRECISHFDLVEGLVSNSTYEQQLRILCSIGNHGKVFDVIDSEFCNLMSKARVTLIKAILDERFSMLNRLINR